MVGILKIIWHLIRTALFIWKHFCSGGWTGFPEVPLYRVLCSHAAVSGFLLHLTVIGIGSIPYLDENGVVLKLAHPGWVLYCPGGCCIVVASVA